MKKLYYATILILLFLIFLQNIFNEEDSTGCVDEIRIPIAIAENEEKIITWILDPKKDYDKDNYKNDTIENIQKIIRFEWKMEEWKVRTFLAWIYLENGSISPGRIARGSESSYGLCMCNPVYRECEPAGDFFAQLRQCLDWFTTYTENSTRESIYHDIRKGHNPRSETYENELRKKELFFIEKI